MTVDQFMLNYVNVIQDDNDYYIVMQDSALHTWIAHTPQECDKIITRLKKLVANYLAEIKEK